MPGEEMQRYKAFLRPASVVKMMVALMTFILLVYMFVTAGKYADVMWKTVIGRSHVLMVAVMAFTMISVALAFLFYFYKIFIDYSFLCFFISIGCAAVYMVEYIAFCALFVSDGNRESYSAMITAHVESTRDDATEWFRKKYGIEGDTGIEQFVADYCSARTGSVKVGLSWTSMLWIVLYATLLFVVLFESPVDQGDNNDRFMRHEDEI